MLRMTALGFPWAPGLRVSISMPRPMMTRPSSSFSLAGEPYRSSRVPGMMPSSTNAAMGSTTLAEKWARFFQTI